MSAPQPLFTRTTYINRTNNSETNGKNQITKFTANYIEGARNPIPITIHLSFESSIPTIRNFYHSTIVLEVITKRNQCYQVATLKLPPNAISVHVKGTESNENPIREASLKWNKPFKIEDLTLNIRPNTKRLSSGYTFSLIASGGGTQVQSEDQEEEPSYCCHDICSCLAGFFSSRPPKGE